MIAPREQLTLGGSTPVQLHRESTSDGDDRWLVLAREGGSGLQPHDKAKAEAASAAERAVDFHAFGEAAHTRTAT